MASRENSKPRLSLGLDLVAENKVSGQPEDDEENAQDDEIYVELRVFHIQQLQDFLRLLELAHVPRTLQLGTVHPIDGQDHPLEAVPARLARSKRDVS